MIEQELFFALGFCGALLLAFAGLPAVWHRAVRLSTRRLERLVPLSGEEIAAERDALRATFAVDQRRLEQRLDRSEEARAEVLIDAGQRASQVAERDNAIARARVEIAALEADLARSTRDLNGARAECGAASVALYDATSLAEQRAEEVRALQDEVRALGGTLDERRATIAALETRALGLASRVEDTGKALTRAKTEGERLVEALQAAERERDTLGEARDALARERDATRRSAEDGAEGAVVPTLDEREEPRADVASIPLHPPAAGRPADLAALRAENAALAQALAQARAERDRAAAGAAGEAGGDAELARLRRAIAEVADDVLRGLDARAGVAGSS